MNCKIQYHPEKNHQYPEQETPNSRQGFLLLAVAVLLLALSRPLLPELKETVEKYRKIYDISILSNRIQEGDSLKDSVTAFCTHVLSYEETD